MPYMLMIVEQPEKRRNRPPEEGRVAYERMERFSDELRARGILRASDALRSDSEAVRVEIRNGGKSVIDGPFTECKEIIGGFFLIDCATKAEAVAIAGECPAAEWSTVEVREVGRCWEEAPGKRGDGP